MLKDNEKQPYIKFRQLMGVWWVVGAFGLYHPVFERIVRIIRIFE